MSRIRVNSISLRRIVLIALFGALSYALMLLVHFRVGFLTLTAREDVIACCPRLRVVFLP